MKQSTRRWRAKPPRHFSAFLEAFVSGECDSVSGERAKRKLAAILSADVKGYSRLMEDDEEATVRTITAYREVMRRHIQGNNGRVLDAKGDNVLAEFASVVDAVESAVEIQKELKAKNVGLPENRRMEFRIGINLGDVIEERERTYGDGVNIAARIEDLAEGGGICISGAAYDQVENKLALDFGYLGERTVKNIKKPVRVYRVRMDKDVSGVGMSPQFPLPDKPSIAVLPFVNMSDDPEQQYFSDGIAEDIITSLSKIGRIFVIARNSSFSYRGKSVRVQQVSRELGVRYVLEGSVRRGGERIRLNAQLIDATSGHHLWAETYERDLKDIFVLQDEITREILTALQVNLTDGEQARVWARGTENRSAWEEMLQAMEHFRRFNKEDNFRARQLFQEAIEMDPNYSMAHVMLAWTHWSDARFGFSKDPAESFRKAIEYTQALTRLENPPADTYALLGTIYLFQGKHAEAIEEIEKAVELNPNHDSNIAILAFALNYAGRSHEAISVINKAMRLSPFYPDWYLVVLGEAYSFTGQYEKAIEIFRKRIEFT